MDADRLDDRLALRLRRLPQGAFAHELWRRLNETGSSAGRVAVAQRLVALQRAGLANVTSRRWHSRPESVAERPTPPDGLGRLLNGIEIEIRATPPTEEIQEEIPSGAIEPSWAMLRRLAPHYGECLRLAGSSRLSQVPERHGEQFAVLVPDRPSWWPTSSAGARLRLPSAPAKLLEALYRRRSYPAYLGYPISVVQTREGEQFIRPVGIIECRWRVEDGAVLLEPNSSIPLLNPDWVSGLRRNRQMAEVMAWLGAGSDAADDGLASIRAGDWADVPGMAQTLGIFMASQLRNRLDPFRPTTALPIDGPGGIYNALALFLPDVNRYTGRARADLDALATIGEAELHDTALAATLGLGGGPPSPIPVLPPLATGEDQFLAARDGLAQPLTVISGPPGTGKSQVVASIMVSAALAGRSVLFASRTHQALDAVEQRLGELLPERVLVARGRAPEREREFDFGRALEAILARSGDGSAKIRLESTLSQIRATEQRLRATFDATDDLAEATARLAALSALPSTSSEPSASPARSHARQLFDWLLSLFRSVRAGSSPRTDTAKTALSRAEEAHRDCRAQLEARQAECPVETTLEDLRREVRQLLPLLAESLDAVSAAERPRLAALIGDLGLASSADAKLALWRENADLVLQRFPIWAVTTLSAGGRIPLVPGLFDYVVIDEATTCDLASALPLLVRAKRAIVVGDKMQTGLVVDLEPRRELEMLDRAGLRRAGIGRFAFTQASLYDLAASAPGAHRHMLRDHYRCSAEIADYVSETFYGRRLNVLTNEKGLRAPVGMRPGLHWTDIEGPIERAGHGCVAPAEAEAVADQLVRLLETQSYEGTVGVVTPFARQAERIRRLCDGRLSPAAIERTNLRVATSHSFQGDARDVVLISPCYGPDTPQGGVWFLRDQAELFNVAVSRARAVCHVFGNLGAAQRSAIPHLAALARRIGRPVYAGSSGEERFESPWERKLYEALVARGLKPLPQFPLAGRRLDLALMSNDVRLDVEVDGDAWHRDPDGFRKVSDLWRDHLVRSLGWRVVRFWVYELRDDMEKCVERILQELS